MAAIALSGSGVRVVESVVQATLPVNEAVSAGQAVRIDPASGQFTPANASSDAEAAAYGIALASQQAGLPVTALRLGVMEGFDLSAQSYGADVFLGTADGGLDDAAPTATGSVSVVAGFIIPATADSPYSKLLAVEVR